MMELPLELDGGDWNMDILFSQKYWEVSPSQLTNSYFSDGLKPPASLELDSFTNQPFFSGTDQGPYCLKN